MGPRFPPCQAPFVKRAVLCFDLLFSPMSPVWRPSDCFLPLLFFLLSLVSVFDSPLGIMRYVSSTRSIASRGNSFNNDTRKVQHSHITTMLGSRSKHTTRTTLSLHSTQQFLCHLGPRLLCIPRNGRSRLDGLVSRSGFRFFRIAAGSFGSTTFFLRSRPLQAWNRTAESRKGSCLSFPIYLAFVSPFFSPTPQQPDGFTCMYQRRCVCIWFLHRVGQDHHRSQKERLVTHTLYPPCFPFFFLISFVLEV